jgi:hypothetical protein
MFKGEAFAPINRISPSSKGAEAGLAKQANEVHRRDHCRLRAHRRRDEQPDGAHRRRDEQPDGQPPKGEAENRIDAGADHHLAGIAEQDGMAASEAIA